MQDSSEYDSDESDKSFEHILSSSLSSLNSSIHSPASQFSFPAHSPEYGSDNEEEELEVSHVSATSSEGSEVRSPSPALFDSDSAESGDELSVHTDESNDNSSNMPTTRRSVRLSQTASLNSSVSSGSAGPSTRNDSSHQNDSSGTEDYDYVNNTPGVIEINDTQQIDEANEDFEAIEALEEDDDDVIHIPQYVETIDLCTQAVLTPRRFRIPVGAGEVIEIEDSPLTQNVLAPVMNSRRSTRDNARAAAAPYQKPNSSSALLAKRLNLEDSQEEGATQSVKISCPICLESIIGRQPVSTICGHLFCKQCIKAALQTTKKCPMCKKTLKATNFHDIFLGV